MGGSFGAGNYAMAGRAYHPNLLFVWPNSRIAVMGAEQASEVLLSIKREKNVKNNSAGQEATGFKQKILESFDEESSALYSTARIWDDGIVDPSETRKILAAGISMTLNRPFPEWKQGIYRM
jgi:acetyl-CoA carboxylase carboxyltransferase component